VALIERVEQRVHAEPGAAPGPNEWPRVTAESAEYRRVKLTGHWLEGHQTLVRAVTELGEGFWLMEPIETDEGFVVWVNRGFVPQGSRDDGAKVAPTPATDASAAAPAATQTSEPAAHATPRKPSAVGAEHSTEIASSLSDAAHATAERAPSAATNAASVTGLLRISEPHGAFLRSNDPANHRWYSRDVEAISHAQHLTDAAPYFVDAEAASGGPQTSRPPVAGLTVIHFRNSHLQYVFTWFTLALMALWLGVRVARAR